MNYKNLFGWLSMDMAVFLVINILLIYFFQNRFLTLLNIDFFAFVVLGLATFRAANIISSEVVTKPLRAPFVDEKIIDGKKVEEPKKKGFLGAFGLLIYCPSCSGVWIAATLLYFYIFWPTQTFFVAFFLALSAVERIISAILVYLKKGE